jgi:hypothetical protein
MSKPANPLELVDRYLQAVHFWLPKTQRQEEVLAELGEDLRSQIETRAAGLGRPLEASEVSEILKRCGAPMVVASRLGPNQHLIGPALYPIYTFVLKMVLLWILVPVFVFIVGPVNVVNSNGNWGAAIGNTIGDLWSGLFIAAGIITLVFAILERSHAQAQIACKFDPLALPPVHNEERKPRPVHTLCELAFGVFGLIWLLLLPQYPLLILGPAASFLRAAPMWHSFYVPIVLLSIVALLRPAITLARPQWGWFPPLGELVQGVLSLILLRFILNAAETSIADGQGFLMLTEAARSSPQYVRVAAVVNLSILLSLVCVWAGLCIALVRNLWQLLGYLRQRVSGTRPTVPVQVR